MRCIIVYNVTFFIFALGTGRSVPSTPLQASPQEAGPSTEEQNPPAEGIICESYLLTNSSNCF